MNKNLRNLLQFFLFLGIGLFILFLVYRGQNDAHLNECCISLIPDYENLSTQAQTEQLASCRTAGLSDEQCPPLLDKLINDFSTVRWGWIALVLLAFVLSNVARTFKWLMLMHPMGYRPRFINGFLSVLVTYFANLGLPRMGEVVRAGLLSKYEGIPVEKVMGTIVVDRVVDVLCLLLAFGIAMLFEAEKILEFISNNSGGGEGGNNLLLYLGMAGIAGLAVFFIFRKQLMQTVLFQKIQKMLKGFWEGIVAVGKLERPGLFIFYSLLIWALFFLMTWLGFKAFPPTAHLGLQAALGVFVFGTLGFVIPVPGGVGTFHFFASQALIVLYGIASADALSAANIIFFTVQIGLNSLLGILALILLPVVNRE